MRNTKRYEEFEEFVIAAWPRLRRAAYLLCRDSHLAEDLTQTALTRIYVRWARARIDEPYAYARRALVNAYIDTTRRTRSIPWERAPDQGVHADDSAVERSELADLLATLSARERSIVVWRYYLDAPVSEVAKRFKCSESTVKSTASRALSQLRVSASALAENE